MITVLTIFIFQYIRHFGGGGIPSGAGEGNPPSPPAGGFGWTRLNP